MPGHAPLLLLCFTLQAAEAQAPPPARADGMTIGAPSPIDPDLVVTRLHADAWMVTHIGGFRGNCLLVRMVDGSLVLCDTPAWPAATETLLDWVCASFSRMPTMAFNSHYHFDASGGNNALERRGVATVGHTKTIALHRERAEALRGQLVATYPQEDERRGVYQEETFAPPRVGLDLTKTASFYFAGRGGGGAPDELRVIYPGPAHTEDNIVFWFPRHGVLFGGCMVRGANSLGPLDEADLDAYASSVRSLMGLGAEIVVTGHGEDTGPENLERTLRLALDAKKNR